MKKIIVLGTGFAGIETALRLKKALPKNEVVLISDDDCFTFSPLLYEVAAGELSEADACILVPSIAKKIGLVYYHDCVVKIDPIKKIVFTQNQESIGFDVLILAVGAITNFSNIEGQNLVFPLKTKLDAERIFERVENCIEKNQPHRFVVCGAGLTGIEFATTLKDHLDVYCKKLKVERKNFSISILHGPARILPNLPEKASAIAFDYLMKNGIEVVCGFYTKKILEGKVVSKEGKEFFSDTVIWAGGIRTHDLIINSNIPYSGMLGERGSPGGGALVNEFLQCKDFPSMFALGDCSSINEKTAQNAVDQAKVVAKNVVSFLKQKRMQKYESRKSKFYCALGKNYGLYVEGRKVIFGKKVRAEKEKQESKYVETLSKKFKPSKGIYKFL